MVAGQLYQLPTCERKTLERQRFNRKWGFHFCGGKTRGSQNIGVEQACNKWGHSFRTQVGYKKL